MIEGPYKVLLVDDDEDDYLLTRDLLQDIDPQRYRLEWAVTYEAGWEAIQRRAHDVYLLDYRIGARTGLELLREAMAAGGRPAPFIMLTGQGDREVDLEAMRSGAADYLVKAELKGDVLERAIRYALERQHAEDALRQRTEDLQRSNAELEHFTYVASHDLQEPLRMVTNYLQLLARRYHGVLDTDADEFITFAVDGATRLKRLINDLLAYSRIGTRGKPFEPTDSEKVFRWVMTNLEPKLKETDATVTHDPLPVILADDNQLAQVFQQLLSNALKFRKTEPPRIHVAAERREGRWLFAVRDNGIGIDPAYADRIFVIFQRLHKREDYPGTGIGLAICKKAVERHGGRIWTDPHPEGATFCFTMPAVADITPVS